MKDARDLVVLAVGASYLQVFAAKERVTAEQANSIRRPPSSSRPHSNTT